MSILITGGCGFAGHHLVEHLLANTAQKLVVIDSLTYAGRTERIIDVAGYDPDRVRILWHDLRAPLHDYRVLDDVSAVFHLAAESHVDRSIDDPVHFFTNNIPATVNLLEWARRRPLSHFVQISTDEVYGAAPDGYSHREWDPIIPSNPYSASKAGQEAAAISYWRTFGVPVVITNTMNLYGERQHPEKFVAMLVKKISQSWPIILHGRPKASIAGGTEWTPSARHWLHARNHADALLWVLQRPVSMYGDGSDRPDRWNVAGEERTVLEMANAVGLILHKQPSIKWEDYHSSRPGHDHRYALDSSRIYAAGWKPPLSLEDALGRTVKWMVDHPEWLR